MWRNNLRNILIGIIILSAVTVGVKKFDLIDTKNISVNLNNP